ncbi:nuclear transport factor 2 family protein [Microbispora sp. NBC_01389]|uniref:nuclear transport factor 2 family protein n=1 Tax=Microbispora sp. NBC_01389 TaxID=2903584 RepID=UPI00324DAC4B
MDPHEKIIRTLFSTIDTNDWATLRELVTSDITYDRPGFPKIIGVDDLCDFYQEKRPIGNGVHELRSVVSDTLQGFCWGHFSGVSREGAALDELFADWFEFHDGRVRRRRTFFYRPAI